MPAGYTYDSYKAAVVTQIPSLVTDPNFLTVLPDAIDYAELTIYRDLDFLALHGLLDLGPATLGSMIAAIPSAVIVLEQLFYGPNQIPVTPASQDYIRAVWAGAPNGPPVHFMPIGAAAGANWTPATQVIMGPAPDQAYELTGYCTQREATLSETHTTTFISEQLPDLLWAASMIFFSGYNRNFGAMTDDPKQATSWAAEYKRLLDSAMIEEARKKMQSQGWQAEAPTPVASPRT